MPRDPWPMVNPGDFRHRVAIYEILTTKNADAGGVSNMAMKAADVPASLNPRRGRLFWQAKQTNSQVDSEIIIRPVEGIRAKMQVWLGSPARVFKILSVIRPEERNLPFIHLFCEEING